MKIKDVLKSFGYIILYVVIMIIFGVINEIFFKDNSMLQWISIFENILILLCFLSIFKFKLKTIKSFKKEYIKYIAKYWVIGLVLLLITNYIVIYINGGIAPNEAANREQIYAMPFYSIASMCFIAPFLEELLFRYNFKYITNKYVYVILTGIVFALMHVIFSLSEVSELLYIIPYSMLGFALGMIYKKCDDNLYSTIFTHMLHNTFTVIVIMFGL